MEAIMRIWRSSLLGRFLAAVCLWFGAQWENSRVVQAFLAPLAGEETSRSSVFFRLWQKIREILCKLYRALRLDKLFSGSIFLQTWFWCGAAAALAPILPTMAVLGLAGVGYCSLALRLLREPGRELAYSPINRYIILYAAVYLAGTALSVDLAGSLQPGILTVAFILFAVVLYNAVTSRSQLDFILFLMVLAAAAVSVCGILQYVFRWGYQAAAWVDKDMFGDTFRAYATLENPNMLGQYLILAIPLGGAKLLGSRRTGERVFYFCCCGVMCVCMLLTMSRGAWLGLLCAGAAFFILLNPRLIILAPFALAALYFVLPDSVVSRFTSIGNLTDNSSSYRVSIWMGTLAMLRDGYWMCGIGPGTAAFNSVYPFYSYNHATALHSHNLFLQIVCEAGACALAVFGVMLFCYFRHLCGALKRERDLPDRLLLIAFICGIGGFLVQGMTDFSFYNYRVLLLFWSYLSLGCLCARRSALPEREVAG